MLATFEATMELASHFSARFASPSSSNMASFFSLADLRRRESEWIDISSLSFLSLLIYDE